MLRQITAILLAIAFAACGQADRGDGSGASRASDAVAHEALAMAPMAPPPPRQVELPDFEMDVPTIQPDPDGSGGGAPPGTAPLMAYSYSWNDAVPTGAMEALQASHKKLCEDAGPANCYVTNASLDAIGREEGASGVLAMRATETWVRAFEQGVNDGLKPFGASVYSTNRNAEELTAQVVDNAARLRSMTAHRDALQKMLEDKQGPCRACSKSSRRSPRPRATSIRASRCWRR